MGQPHSAFQIPSSVFQCHSAFRIPHSELRILKKSDWFNADGFPLAVERRDPQQPFGPHTHDFSEIVIVTGGTGLHVAGTESWRLTAGDAFVIGGTQPHNYEELAVTLEDLADIAHMPKRSFLRDFQLATGSTPINYLIELRVNQAARLLRDTSESVTNIAFDVGFGDSNYFSRQFRKLMAVSPRTYRRQHSEPG